MSKKPVKTVANPAAKPATAGDRAAKAAKTPPAAKAGKAPDAAPADKVKAVAAKAPPAAPVAAAPKPSAAKTSRASARDAAPVAAPPPPVPQDRDFAEQVAARSAVDPSPYRIFQIYYEDWHRDLLDPAFQPFDNIGTPTELMEFDIFERLARSKAIEGATYWGALSWRFTEKTGLTGADLIKVMEEHPDVDVFFCNPHVHNEALYHNMWVQGETSHPRFLEMAKAFFEATGLPVSELELVMPAGSYSAANYFVGKPAFWQAYLPFVRRIVTLAEQKLSPEYRKLLHSSAADDRGLHGGSTYLPFIVERLFPIFLRAAAGKLKGLRVSLPQREQELNIHLKLLRDMKDVSIRTKSPWLGACWVNYRALYMSQHNGREWCQKYLRAITPPQIKFP